jgi:hypothetical protein
LRFHGLSCISTPSRGRCLFRSAPSLDCYNSHKCRHRRNEAEHESNRPEGAERASRKGRKGR